MKTRTLLLLLMAFFSSFTLNALNAQSISKESRSALNRDYYDTGLYIGYVVKLARLELLEASKKISRTNPETSKELLNFSRTLPIEKKCLNEESMASVVVSDYQRRKSVKNERVNSLLFSATRFFEDFEHSQLELCAISQKLCDGQHFELELEARRKELGKLLHQTYRPFQRLTKKWSAEKALSLVISTQGFDWDKHESRLPEGVTLWWAAAKTEFSNLDEKADKERIIRLYEYFCVHVQVCSKHYMGKELANSKEQNQKILKKYSGFKKQLESMMHEYLCKQKPKCERKKFKGKRLARTKRKTATLRIQSSVRNSVQDSAQYSTPQAGPTTIRYRYKEFPPAPPSSGLPISSQLNDSCINLEDGRVLKI